MLYPAVRQTRQVDRRGSCCANLHACAGSRRMRTCPVYVRPGSKYLSRLDASSTPGYADADVSTFIPPGEPSPASLLPEASSWWTEQLGISGPAGLFPPSSCEAHSLCNPVDDRWQAGPPMGRSYCHSDTRTSSWSRHDLGCSCEGSAG